MRNNPTKIILNLGDCNKRRGRSHLPRTVTLVPPPNTQHCDIGSYKNPTCSLLSSFSCAEGIPRWFWACDDLSERFFFLEFHMSSEPALPENHPLNFDLLFGRSSLQDKRGVLGGKARKLLATWIYTKVLGLLTQSLQLLPRTKREVWNPAKDIRWRTHTTIGFNPHLLYLHAAELLPTIHYCTL